MAEATNHRASVNPKAGTLRSRVNEEVGAVARVLESETCLFGDLEGGEEMRGVDRHQ